MSNPVNRSRAIIGLLPSLVVLAMLAGVVWWTAVSPEESTSSQPTIPADLYKAAPTSSPQLQSALRAQGFIARDINQARREGKPSSFEIWKDTQPNEGMIEIWDGSIKLVSRDGTWCGMAPTTSVEQALSVHSRAMTDLSERNVAFVPNDTHVTVQAEALVDGDTIRCYRYDPSHQA